MTKYFHLYSQIFKAPQLSDLELQLFNTMESCVGIPPLPWKVKILLWQQLINRSHWTTVLIGNFLKYIAIAYTNVLLVYNF